MIYLDNAATTPLDQRVLDAMMPFYTTHYGNPSSIHQAGRQTKLAIEEARKKIASLLTCKPADLFFTSCGTESTNTILNAAVRKLACKNIITSPIEHHATLNTAQNLCDEFGINIHYAKHLDDGSIDYDHLKNLIQSCAAHGKTLVSLMHANNEIGVINNIEQIGNQCQEYGVLFHSDMVQTIGHMPINFKQLAVDFASASAHKFHGPKGMGFIYVNTNTQVQPLLTGGGQERNMRAGTENVAGVVGMSYALEMAIEDLESENAHCMALKKYCWEQLQDKIGDVKRTTTYSQVLPRVLNVMLPHSDKTEMLQMALDIKGIAVSGGSACSSGALGGSHVINHLHKDACVPMRVSFSKWNTQEEIDALIQAMVEVLN